MDETIQSHAEHQAKWSNKKQPSHYPENTKTQNKKRWGHHSIPGHSAFCSSSISLLFIWQNIGTHGLHLNVCVFRTPHHLHDLMVGRITALACQGGCLTSNAHSLLHLNSVPLIQLSLTTYASLRSANLHWIFFWQIMPILFLFLSMQNSPKLPNTQLELPLSMQTSSIAIPHLCFSRTRSLILCLINKILPDVFTSVNWSAHTHSAFWFQCIPEGSMGAKY